MLFTRKKLHNWVYFNIFYYNMSDTNEFNINDIPYD